MIQNLHLLPKVADRITFLYIEHATICKKDEALTIMQKNNIYSIPYGTILCLLLGPGTSITHDAIKLISKSGMSIAWVGEHDFYTYATGTSLNHSSICIERQANYFSNPKTHLQIARKMYQMRFPNENFKGLSIAKMRGKEGNYVKHIYAYYASKYHVDWHGRSYQPQYYSESDLTNKALTTSNQYLYGICLSVVKALNFSPSLGFIHVGLENSFIYDLADLYKADITIPIAFKTVANCTNDNFYKLLRENLQEIFTKKHILRQMVSDLFTLFDISKPDLIDVLYLWDNIKTLQKAGIQYKLRR